jgi:hypothetical protein
MSVVQREDCSPDGVPEPVALLSASNAFLAVAASPVGPGFWSNLPAMVCHQLTITAAQVTPIMWGPCGGVHMVQQAAAVSAGALLQMPVASALAGECAVMHVQVIPSSKHWP